MKEEIVCHGISVVNGDESPLGDNTTYRCPACSHYCVDLEYDREDVRSGEGEDIWLLRSIHFNAFCHKCSTWTNLTICTHIEGGGCRTWFYTRPELWKRYEADHTIEARGSAESTSE